jgi:6-phosphofructokinase 2
MNKMITLTVNPVLDKNTMVNRWAPGQKLGCSAPVFYAGGGGINVSRAIQNLGGSTLAIYMAGGPYGAILGHLLTGKGIDQKIVDIEERTRENTSVMDWATQMPYHFGDPGPHVLEHEWRKALELVEAQLGVGDYLIASGKLTSGIPEDFYVRVANIVGSKKARLVLDTKGPALRKAVGAKIFLFKPNIRELSELYGAGTINHSQLETLAQKFYGDHNCEVLVVSLGARGALLVTSETMVQVSAPLVVQKSMIGAGDSMVAGMVLAHKAGKNFVDMVRYGVACGSAATLNQGAQLCRKDDVDQLLESLKIC